MPPGQRAHSLFWSCSPQCRRSQLEGFVAPTTSGTCILVVVGPETDSNSDQEALGRLMRSRHQFLRSCQRLDRRALEGGSHFGENLEAGRNAPLIDDEVWLVNVRADLTWSSDAKTS
jgi:hypothetical protein